MSVRGLLDPDCGGQNPLVQLSTQFTRDVAYRDEGIGARLHQLPGTSGVMSQEFLQQIHPAPQTFHLNELMQEMHDIEGISTGRDTRKTLDILHGSDWAKEFGVGNLLADGQSVSGLRTMGIRMTPMMMGGTSGTQGLSQQLEKPKIGWTNDFFKAEEEATKEIQAESEIEDWVKAFETSKDADEHASGLHNRQFWEKLQDEWRRISEEQEAEGHPWLSDFTEIYDPYKEYKFDEENPMIDVENALEKGKAFLVQGDIPSAVLCFEAAVKQNPKSVEIWELLGTTQAENENDPNAIPALKQALELNPNNMNVLMSLAVCYTNESYQNQALKMLTNWLATHPKYSHIVPPSAKGIPGDTENMATSSIAKPLALREVQEMFLKAVQMNPAAVDPDVQEALGVLFNLSSEYDKAVDCFKAAIQAKPNDAKTWNKLGASLANGNRSVEAVEAYQNALEIQPGFIRARYNVGIICINLKAYKEAAEHLLTALNHQATSTARAGINSNSKQMSDSIWGTLRMAVSLAGRHELQDAISNRDLNALNSAFNTAD